MSLGNFSKGLDHLFVFEKFYRGTTIFYRGSFAKTPMFEGHDYFPIGNKWNYPRGACVNNVFDLHAFSL